MSAPRKICQAGAVPFRFSRVGLEFCLITARKSGRWGFPKGWIRRYRSIEETALVEAFEEAGVQGRVVGLPLGEYEYRKAGQQLSVAIVLMEVACVLPTWNESDQRERRWATYADAANLLERPALVKLLTAAVERLKIFPLANDGQNRANRA